MTCKDHLGNEYPSVSAMGRAYGIAPDTLYFRIKSGIPLEEALCDDKIMPGANPCEDHLGNKYPSMSAMAREYGLSLSGLKKRLASGKSLSEALSAPKPKSKSGSKPGSGSRSPTRVPEKRLRKNTCLRERLPKLSEHDKPGGRTRVKDHKGNRYESIRTMAETYGITESTLKGRLMHGWDMEKALTEQVGSPMRDHLGNEYRSLSALAKTYGIGRGTLKRRLMLGWDIKKALTEPAVKPGTMRSETCFEDFEGRKFASKSALRYFYGLSSHVHGLITKANAKTDFLKDLIIRRFENSAIDDIKVDRCVSYPWFEVTKDKAKYMMRIEKILDIYHACQNKQDEENKERN